MDKKLYRSDREKMFAGVCGGLAEYLNVDAAIIRLIWALTFFAGGIGLLAYIIAAIIIPKEETTENAQQSTEKGTEQETTFTDGDGSTNYTSDEPQNEGPRGNSSGEKSNSLIFIGSTLLIVGILVLLNKFYPFHKLFRYIRGYGWPIILIASGILILLSSLHSRKS